METIGAYLKRIREERGLSIDQVTLKTRINKDYLRALEENRLEDFPGEVFARGFVRAYGRCLGLDDDETLTRFDQSARNFFRERDESKRTSEQSVEQEKSRKAFQGRVIQFSVIAALVIAIVTVYTLNSRNLERAQENANAPPPPIAALEEEPAVPLEGLPDLSDPAVNRPGMKSLPAKPTPVPAARPESKMPTASSTAPAPGSEPPPPPTAQAPPTVPKTPAMPKPSEGPTPPPTEKIPLIVNVPGKPEAAPAPGKPSVPGAPAVPSVSAVPSAPPSPPAPPSAATAHPAPVTPGKTMTLVIEAIEPAWVAAKIDGGQVKEVYLRPGDKVVWDATDHFMVSLGNAGGVKMEFDGKPLPSYGASGQVVKNLRFPKE
jgi:cytoskeleton protein RodZ